jgi:hypothetical protein
MTDEEYRAFLTVLFRRHVQPRLPRVRRRFHHHMMEEWQYHLDQAERSARVLRYIENYCEDGDDVYGTFTLDRLASAVHETRYGLEFSNRAVDESGLLDAYELHVGEILSGLQPHHLPEIEKDVLRDMGSPDPEAELAELVFRARADRNRSAAMRQEVSVRQQLRNIEEQVAKAGQEFDELRKSQAEPEPKEFPKKSRRWFKGLGQIGQGAALSIANVALAVGAIHFPVSLETQTWGVVASVATGIGTVLGGVGDLKNE